MIESFHLQRGGGRFFGQDKIQTVNSKLGEEVRIFAFQTKCLDLLLKVEDGFDNLVSNQLGQGISDADVDAQRGEPWASV